MKQAVLLLLLLPLYAEAQEPIGPSLNAQHHFGPPVFESAADSADFMRFRSGIRAEDLMTAEATPDIVYRLVWQEAEHGGRWSVTRGDGTPPPKRDRNTRLGALEYGLPFRTAEGERGLLISSEYPCAMICRSAWYYVEE
ncbi:MAG: hypothetical protein JNM62_12460 [Flavobacteriales bacterium]|nr:hypothetical protein [Flavobacteriales bacterium]